MLVECPFLAYRLLHSNGTIQILTLTGMIYFHALLLLVCFLGTPPFIFLLFRYNIIQYSYDWFLILGFRGIMAQNFSLATFKINKTISLLPSELKVKSTFQLESSSHIQIHTHARMHIHKFLITVFSCVKTWFCLFTQWSI